MNSENKKAIDFESLNHEYNSVVDEAGRFCQFVAEELNNAVEHDDIKLSFPIQTRIKQWKSIKEKLERVPINIFSVTDLQDLVGLRVIVLFPRDVYKVGGVITKTFRVVRHYDTKDRLKHDQFGYTSMHYVVQLSQDMVDGATRQFRSSFKAEIQVRTIAQHLWAEASRVLQYKEEKSIPESISRDIHRLSAQLETVDKQLDGVLENRNKYRSGIVDLETDARLNVDLLEITLDALWPIEHKTGREKYDYLLWQLEKYGIITQRQLVEVVRKHRDSVIRRSAREAEYLRNLVETHPIENNRVTIRLKNKVVTRTISPALIERVNKGLFYSQVALTITAAQFESGERDEFEPIE